MGCRYHVLNCLVIMEDTFALLASHSIVFTVYTHYKQYSRCKSKLL